MLVDQVALASRVTFSIDPAAAAVLVVVAPDPPPPEMLEPLPLVFDPEEGIVVEDELQVELEVVELLPAEFFVVVLVVEGFVVVETELPPPFAAPPLSLIL